MPRGGGGMQNEAQQAEARRDREREDRRKKAATKKLHADIQNTLQGSEDKDFFQAAILIQGLQRKFRARKEVERIRANNAATLVQRRYRNTKFCSKIRYRLSKYIRAATNIERIVRGWLVRKQFRLISARYDLAVQDRVRKDERIFQFQLNSRHTCGQYQKTVSEITSGVSGDAKKLNTRQSREREHLTRYKQSRVRNCQEEARVMRLKTIKRKLVAKRFDELKTANFTAKEMVLCGVKVDLLCDTGTPLESLLPLDITWVHLLAMGINADHLRNHKLFPPEILASKLFVQFRESKKTSSGRDLYDALLDNDFQRSAKLVVKDNGAGPIERLASLGYSLQQLQMFGNFKGMRRMGFRRSQFPLFPLPEPPKEGEAKGKAPAKHHPHGFSSWVFILKLDTDDFNAMELSRYDLGTYGWTNQDITAAANLDHDRLRFRTIKRTAFNPKY